MNYHDIIVIGSSAGGIGIMQELVKQFRKDSPASIFWVQHLAPQSTTKIILESIQNKTEITCRIRNTKNQFRWDVCIWLHLTIT